MSEDIKVTDETTEAAHTNDVSDETAQSINDSIEEQTGTEEIVTEIEKLISE